MREILGEQKEYYRKLAEDYRLKYINLEKEFVFMKDSQKHILKQAKSDNEHKWEREIKKLEALNKIEFDNFEAYLDEKDAEIDHLKEENQALHTKLAQ